VPAAAGTLFIRSKTAEIRGIQVLSLQCPLRDQAPSAEAVWGPRDKMAEAGQTGTDAITL
jgi:hypothetical protein